MKYDATARMTIRQSTLDVLTRLEVTNRLVLIRDSRPAAGAVGHRATYAEAVRTALFRAAAQIAVDMDQPPGQNQQAANWPAIRRQLRLAVGAGTGTDEGVAYLVDRTELLVRGLWSVIARLADALAQEPGMSADDRWREIDQSLMTMDEAEAAVIATKAIVYYEAGHKVLELTIDSPTPGMVSYFGTVTTRRVGSVLQGILDRRAETLQSKAFHDAHPDLVASVMETTRQFQRGRLPLHAFVDTLQRLERAVDTAIWPVDSAFYPALGEAADLEARISLAIESIYERTTGVAVPVWTSRGVAAMALARLPVSPREAVGRYEAHRASAIEFIDRHSNQIRLVTIELLRARTIDGETFRRLVAIVPDASQRNTS